MGQALSPQDLSEFTPQEKSITLVEQVLVQIQTSIIKGELPAGSKINEQALAEKYGISRGPTREALQLLERQRLVVRVPHIGARVAALTVEELNDLYELRSTLEVMACELAAKRITEEQLNNLWQLLERQEAALNDGDSYFQQEGDVDFHYQIIRASGNRHLQETLIGGLYHLLRMYRYQCTNNSRRPVRAIAEHRRIVEAIAQRDAELAGLLMRRHIEQGRQNTEQRLKQLQAQTLAAKPQNVC
ncbi:MULTISPECIES: GntR family transcriptional regulator [Shewanella]|jgi:DNA-binding GntR family transcriptional regulator|uniref:GntR family transcriptional regulator n=1 Tax=Shewanella TaxID=22 RepID=UPI001674CD71|nr:GntR family transcriptional regulator [Shewanella fodinae]MCL2908312.1 GntR family transcriptional regulator [Shewanella fodinae]GGZ15226.1 methycitrate-responsive transcriptional regulator of methylisocitrate utilization PrpR [Shewanella fodinae]